MKEPRRLIEETDSFLERSLLAAGASYRGSDELRTKTMTALGLAGTAALAGGSTLSLAPAAKVGWAKLIGAISVLGAAAAGPVGYYAWQRQHEAAPAAVRTTAQTDLTMARAPGMTQRPAAPTAEEPAAPSPASETPAVVKPDRKSSRSADLTAELGVLDTVRSTLAGGDAHRALTLLDAYDRAYPRGRLALESEVLRIDALARSGQSDAAKQRAQAFLRRYPKSVLASRVRGYLGE